MKKEKKNTGTEKIRLCNIAHRVLREPNGIIIIIVTFKPIPFNKAALNMLIVD